MSFVIRSSSLDPSRLAIEESLFHTANGYLGVRAAFEEGYPPGVCGIRGAYLNAFYDTHPIHHPERLHGFPETGERIVNLPDVQGIELFAEGERVLLEAGKVESYERSLDMEAGIARRVFSWKGRRGARVEVEVRRLASLSFLELFAVQYAVRALDARTELRLLCRLEGAVANHFDSSDPRLAGTAFAPLEIVETKAAAEAEGVNRAAMSLEAKTRSTGARLVASSLLETDFPATFSAEKTASAAGLELRFSAEPGAWYRLTRKNLFADSLRHGEPSCAMRELEARARALSFDELATAQREELRRFWSGAAVEVEGDEETLEGLRFGLYGLFQSAPRLPGMSIPAKGLSGEGYEGHYFWDTEIYMTPFFTYTEPALARSVLAYRGTILEGARRHAREMGQKRGAAYPWRTIAGRECSAYYPSGSAQYHINADIAYAILRYLEATEDEDFLVETGAEILFETARIWMELGRYREGSFRIAAVTGPDEYSCIVDDNYYTNALAAHNLEGAAGVYATLGKGRPAELAALVERIGLSADEVETWRKAARAIYLPMDGRLGIAAQDSGFLDREPWDLAATPQAERPLLLHYHHLALRRRQVCKQADVVLAHLLLPDLASRDIQTASYKYYERITTHDSSLSYAVFSAMAARLGDVEGAHRYFAETLRLDLDNLHGNAVDGLHLANMGGAWLAFVFGFGGMEPRGALLSFRPRVPACWKGISFRVLYRGSSLALRAHRKEDGDVRVELELLSGPPLEVEVGGERRRLADREVFP